MNKPVAWIELELWESGKYPPDDCFSEHPFENAIPLYTHPVKELTDEEIKQIFVEESGFDVDTCPIAIMDFARAILRKAQEK